MYIRSENLKILVCKVYHKTNHINTNEQGSFACSAHRYLLDLPIALLLSKVNEIVTFFLLCLCIIAHFTHTYIHNIEM
jgi:disulfide bond formation protein DsbB